MGAFAPIAGTDLFLPRSKARQMVRILMGVVMNGRFEFHAGELAIQDRAGESSMAQRNGTVMADTVIAGARSFIDKQFMVVLSSIDGGGKVWSSLLFGAPGFVQAGQGKDIVLRVPFEERDLDDPLWRNMRTDVHLGLLFIELGSRRRYRVNGHVIRIDQNVLQVRVDEAYPNCPQYIQRRHLRHLGARAGTAPALNGIELEESVSEIVSGADTVFVASGHAERGLDASHRGGLPGFVAILDQRTLRIPDYSGNSLFNTLGNLAVDPRAGLMFMDFERLRLLHVSGVATLHWDNPDLIGTGGTGRYWDLQVESWILRDMPHLTEWEFLDKSPFNHPLLTMHSAP
jgi:predicted pyridoxine 5'-phosphate oxidase superfamily flavin-nucleotide-binding protein